MTIDSFHALGSITAAEREDIEAMEVGDCELGRDVGERSVDDSRPNLIAKPFDISREYAQIIHDQTSSPKLDEMGTGEMG